MKFTKKKAPVPGYYWVFLKGERGAMLADLDEYGGVWLLTRRPRYVEVKDVEYWGERVNYPIHVEWADEKEEAQ